jgi:plastocyanin
MLQPVTRIRMAVCLLALHASAAVLRADKTVQVGQFGNSFGPESVDVVPGEKVIWNFHSTHTTTSDTTTGPEVWDSGILSSGTFSHTFNTVGSYPYYCILHGSPGGIGMSGVVNVLSSTPTPTRTPTRTPTATPTRTPTLTPAPQALVFHTLPPCRVVDTREPNGPFGGPALAAGQDRIFAVAGQCGIPMSARAVAYNVTVTQPTALGHVTLHPAGAAVPATSTLNYRAGQTRANNAIVQLGSGGALGVACGQGSGTVHLIIDVTGYFE